MASRPRAALPLLAFLCYGVEVVWSACSNVTALSAQLDAALSEFDREVMPSAKVSVQMSLDVRHAAINEQASTIRLLADLHMSWQDDRLAWNATELGCEWGLVAAERLWLPDVTLVSAAWGGGGDEPLRARLASAGAVAWAARLDLALPIELRLDYWPNDVQTGVFKFASRAHSADEIELVIKDSQYVTVFEAGSWEMVALSGAVVSSPDEGGVRGRGRQVAAWSLALRRRAPAQALAARVALTAALLLLLAAALLPAHSRAPLAAAAAFTTAMWLCVSAWRVSGGARAPRALAAAAGVCAVSALSAACAALCVRAAALRAPPPQFVRTALLTVSRYWSFTPHVDTEVPPAEGSGSGAGGWSAAARLLDAALLLALALALLVLLCIYL